MAGETARATFADPPFNVRIDGHVCGLGSIKHREFAMASGEMSPEQFTAFLTQALKNAAGVSRDGAIHYVCMDWRHIGELLAAGRMVCSEFKNLCVWVKDNGGMGSQYRAQTRAVLRMRHSTSIDAAMSPDKCRFIRSPPRRWRATPAAR
jgi:hypothetical protein